LRHKRRESAAASAPGGNDAMGGDHGTPLDYTLVENNVRLKCWTDRLDGLHYDPEIFESVKRYGSTGQRPRAPPGHSLDLLVCLRYLVLEAWQFTEIHNFTYGQVIRELDVPGLECLHSIIQSTQGIKEHLRPIRNDLGAHFGRPITELATEMEKVGLANFVLYVRSIVMFQDAVTALPKKGPRGKLGLDGIQRCTTELGSGHTRHRAERESAWQGLDARIDRQKSPLIHHAMSDHAMCLNRLVLDLFRAAARDPKSLESQRRLHCAMLNAKYMVLELDGFIEKYDKAARKCHGLASFRPLFLKNRQRYRDIRNNYSVRSNTKIPDLDSLLSRHPDLLSHIIRDALEADMLAERILPGYPDYGLRVPLLTYGEIHDIEHRLRRIRERSLEHYRGEVARSDYGERRSRIVGRLIEMLGHGDG